MRRIAPPLAVLLLVAAGSSLAADPPVAVDVRGMPVYLADKIRQEAAKGIVPLRQYLDRSYPVHKLRVDMVIATPEPAGQFATMGDHEKSPDGAAAGDQLALRGAAAGTGR